MSLLCRLKNLVHKGILKEKDLERIIIIPKDVTNGNMVKAIFPEAVVHERSNYNYISIDDDVWLEDRNGEWVNSPYKTESEDNG